MTEDKEDLRSMDLPALTACLTGLGFPKFRAKQLYQWLHVRQVDDLADMQNLPKNMKEALLGNCTIRKVRMVDRKISRIDGTQKFLFAMDDDALVESVFMKYKFGNSVCISSQVGCRMGCRFCASTLDGLQRNLLAGEMLGEVYAVQNITGGKISHVVIMGTGEPLDNYDNVVRFLHMLTDEQGMHLSMRNVTLSTCGIVPRIYDLAKEHLSITLALSLHATTDEKRREIMPIANTYSIRQLMDAVSYYFRETGRRITFEYSLIAGVNDSPKEADALASLAAEAGAHVNLIPVNPVKERGYEHPDRKAVEAFQLKLEKHGINVSIRRVLGRDIDGACGQLRHRVLSKNQENH